ncbi:hypothetical protein ACIA5G_49340 [Amycolatopsis sp. NPDC051758]
MVISAVGPTENHRDVVAVDNLTLHELAHPHGVTVPLSSHIFPRLVRR